MKFYKKISLITLSLGIAFSSIAGNKDRVGQAGGAQLLINPWAMSSGMAGANTASATGLEAQYLNVAGLAFTKKTELIYSNTMLLRGADISINSFGLSQRLGENAGVLGVGVMAMNFGDIDITTVNNPEGGLGTFSPQYLNLALSYAKAFSNSIYGGLTVRTISEAISNAGARGGALDLGIKYVTGRQENLKFGIAIKNVGPKMKYTGDGFSFKTEINDETFTVEQRTEAFELPAQLNIGVAYDYYLGATTDSTGSTVKEADHRITGAFNFTSNSFGKDQLNFGAEYAFKKYFMLRAGYVQEEGSMKAETRTTSYSGPTAGFTAQLPFGENGSSIGLSYSYRLTNSQFGGTHSIGARIDL